MILNWIKYNVPNNKNVILCVQREISRVKHIEFVKILFNKYQAAGLDVEKIFENYNIKEIFDSSSAADKASLDCTFEKVDKHPSKELTSSHLLTPLGKSKFLPDG